MKMTTEEAFVKVRAPGIEHAFGIIAQMTPISIFPKAGITFWMPPMNVMPA